VVLTLEGGYTKCGVVDGIGGILEGLEELSRRARVAQRVPIIARRFSKMFDPKKACHSCAPRKLRKSLSKQTASGLPSKRLCVKTSVTQSPRSVDSKRRMPTSASEQPERAKPKRRRTS
jgi:hypothetical protein